MILIVVVWLYASALEPGPSAIHILVLPLNLVEDVCWHTQDTSRTDVAVVIGLHHDIVAHQSVIDNEGGLIGQSEIALRVIRIHNMRTTAILECLGFLPIN
jgi:hypothetical protein